MEQSSEQRISRVISPTGRLDAAAAPQLKQEIASLLAQGETCIIVNLAAVSFLSSSALRALLIGHKEARASGGDLVLCCIQPQVQRVITMIGFDQVFSLYDSEDEARQALTSPARVQKRKR